jgi:molybdopterin/thiamine biosynthesis adenylyltransferase
VDDDQRLRYSRHLLLDDWSEGTQERLLSAHALVIGAGGLGAPALMYLASSGVGRITVVDPDVVELSNLQRQVLHTTERIGLPKVASAQAGVAALNPGVQFQALAQAADAALLNALLPGVDVVLDCTDRFDTRQMINQACVRHGKPLVSASAIRMDAQLAVFDFRDAGSPCYACLFPPDAPPPEERCATLGVFAPLVGAVGVMQAGQAVRLLAGLSKAQPLHGRLLMLDGRSWETHSVRVRKSSHCSVCGPKA